MAFGNFPDKINSNLHPKLPEVAFLENSIYIKTKQNKTKILFICKAESSSNLVKFF